MSELEERVDQLKKVIFSILVDVIKEEMSSMCSRSLKESLLDVVDEFRDAIMKRMKKDNSLTLKSTFNVDRVPIAFQEAWKTWKTAGVMTGHIPFDKLRQQEVSY